MAKNPDFASRGLASAASRQQSGMDRQCAGSALRMKGAASRLAGVLALAMATVGGANVCDAGIGTEAAACLAGYGRYLRELRTLSFHFEYLTYEVGGKVGTTEKLIGFTRGSASVRGDEFRLRRRQRYLIWRGGRFQPHDFESEEVFTARRRIHAQANYAVNGESFDVMDLTNTDAELLVSTWEAPPRIEVGYLDVVSNALHGLLPQDGGRYVIDVIRAADQVEASDDHIGDSLVKRLQCEGRHGTYTVWLDPSAGYALRHMVLRKGAADLFGGAPLSKYPLGDPEDRQPYAAMNGYRFEVEASALESAAGAADHSVMSMFEVSTVKSYEDGESFRQRSAVTLSNLRFECVDSDLEPSMTIPDGTRVFIKDAPGIAAEWRGGEVEKVVNQEALRRFANSKAAAPPTFRWRSPLLLLNFAVVVGALLYFWWMRRRRVADR